MNQSVSFIKLSTCDALKECKECIGLFLSQCNNDLLQSRIASASRNSGGSATPVGLLCCRAESNTAISIIIFRARRATSKYEQEHVRRWDSEREIYAVRGAPGSYPNSPK